MKVITERTWCRVLHWCGFAFLSCWGAIALAAIDPAIVAKLASEEISDKTDAIDALAASGEEGAFAILTALRNGNLQVSDKGQVVVAEGSKVIDAASGTAIDPAPENLEKVTINNRLRSRLDAALSALSIFSKDRKVRLDAAKGINPDGKMLPTLQKALGAETDPEIKQVLQQAEATAMLRSDDAALRLKGVERLAESSDSRVRNLLLSVVEKNSSGEYVETDAKVREAAESALRKIERRLAVYDYSGRVFTGISLGSILLLVALGLAITYGLLGVINMAHGEMLMIGAYATYVTQQFFRSNFPSAVDWYLPAALPVAFLAAAVVGMILERTVIRKLYGRPLETLLATWGISLFLIQLVRQLFGSQNVEVANPSWMSGGLEFTNVVLPYNRIIIIGFALVVLFVVWLLLTRTRLGLFIRGVTQNRTMAACMGVKTERVDLLAFGLGSGIAGLAGCALSQVGNVGPDLGQSYIVDSFMVVVLGGVGQLAGTVYAALGLGVVSKFLEPYIGAVPTKILVLVLIIAFIQKRPQGLFALKGRAVEA